MPKLIDHDQRSTEITEAAWRVLVSRGAAAVSVRNVATEAGLATGSLRRAFPTQTSLLAACLQLMGRRVSARIQALPQSEPLEWALAALSETLPLDATRSTEMEVYLSLGIGALSDPGLQPAYREQSEGLVLLCRTVVTALSPGSDIPLRTAELAALLDGLALHVLHGADPEVALRVLRSHVAGLTASAP